MKQMARLAYVLGKKDLHARLLRESAELKRNFQKKFWSEEIKAYAIALDGKKRPCNVLSSNAGQCLFTGIASPRHAAAIKGHLMQERFFPGWGVRTLASGQKRYNPMGYHNGSIWPHDNALIAWGLNHYGFKKPAVKIMTAFFDASIFMDLHRLPELYCGFPRRTSEGPTLYPVACNPQAWASVFMFLQACLGISVNTLHDKVYFHNPILPNYLERVCIHNLQVGSSRMDILLEYHPGDVGTKVIKRRGPAEVVMLK